MGKTVRNAFTLVELLVVIAIIAITSIYALANYSGFGEDQNLKNAVLDFQNQLRLAQTNATTNSACASNQFGTTWQVYFSNDLITTNLNCQLLPSPLSFPLPSPTPALTTKKTFKLGANITIQSITGECGMVSSCSYCPSAPPLTAFAVRFDPLTGKINIGDDARCTSLTITLRNTKTTNTKSLIIEQGGKIYVQ
ncbi:MAG: prepilin-type N-terminal cleavage/methylation domain-containing protein [Patescibacteria group bacterium]|nr:prepilin-type N-terminal cleavage/methylation domain-containing protein [Patescibacteria group bacterium]